MRDAGVVLLIVGLAVVSLAVFVGLVILSTWIYVWNLTDMQNNGINFWNTFWLVATALFWQAGYAVNNATRK